MLRIRLEEFRRHHPDVLVEKGDFGVWHAKMPLDEAEGYDGGSENLAEHHLEILLDKLEKLFADSG